MAASTLAFESILRHVEEMLDVCKVGWFDQSNLISFKLECIKCNQLDFVMTDFGPRIIAKVTRYRESFGGYPPIPGVIKAFMNDAGETTHLPNYRKAAENVASLESNNDSIKEAIFLEFLHHLHYVSAFLRHGAHQAMMEKHALLAMAEDFLTLEYI
jgi:hypothetical protein